MTVCAPDTHTWHCSHCGLPVPGYRSAVQKEEDVAFCCDGCHAVYQIITGCSLEQYYALKKRSDWFGPSLAAAPGRSRYGYLDEPEVRSKLAAGADGRAVDFFVEGVHCVACLWLLERLGSVVPGVVSARMDLGTRILRVTVAPDGSFASAAEGIDRLGYKPHPVQEPAQAGRLRRAENRNDLIRIGVAAFGTMNIMIFFVSIYGGAQGMWLQGFRWMSGLLYLPVAAYAAFPFYKSAWSSLRARQLHIDLPVAAAMLIGSISSYLHLFSGSDQIYFDSIASFIFLLLSVRYLLKTVHQKAACHQGVGEFLIPPSAIRQDRMTGAETTVAAERLRVSDRVRVPHGEVIPADGEVESAGGFADLHMLSGESEPVALHPGAPVYAGTVNAGPDLLVRVSASGSQTRIGRLLRGLASAPKPAVVTAADRAAKIYLTAVLAASGWLLIFGGGLPFATALDRVLAMIIIACPCALALVTPLAYRLAAAECSAVGAVLKNEDALEKLAKAKHLFLDKTGTVTFGRFGVLEWRSPGNGDPLAAEVLALEKKSRHPIAYALRDHARRLLEADSDRSARPVPESPEVQDFIETLGVGVSGVIGGHRFEVRGIEDPRNGTGANEAAAEAKGVRSEELPVQSAVGVFRDGRLAVWIRLGDRVRPDSVPAAARLREQFRSVHLITGDRDAPAAAAARKLGIDHVTAFMTPEDKRDRVASVPDAVMVGDGANDAPAMSKVSVAIAVQGSIEASLRCADVYLASPGIGAVPELVAIARRTRSGIRWALAVSFAYNLIGMGLAVTGRVNPLVAAIAMPVSSATVLGICYAWIRKRGRRAWK